jgi:hypothetical protein
VFVRGAQLTFTSVESNASRVEQFVIRYRQVIIGEISW